jgi:hypothetical protein
MRIGVFPGESGIFPPRFNGNHFPLVSRVLVIFNGGLSGFAI